MGVNRRRFLMLASGGVAGSLFTPIIWKTLDDVSIWTQNWSWIPRLKYGAIEKKASISKMTAAGQPVQIVTVDGNPVEALGSAGNPLSQGGINALAAPEVQMLYSPARVKAPMKKVGEGKYEQISWEDAEKLLASKVKSAGRKVAAVSGDETGSASEVLAGFVSKLGSKDFFLMPGELQLAVKAWNGQMNGKGLPGYDLENADYVLAIGADLLESWGTSIRNAKAFAHQRPAGAGAACEYAYAGPVRNRTAAVSDQWIPVVPGGEAAFALGVAYHLLSMGASADADGIEAFKKLVMAEYTPAKVEAMIGVSGAVTKAVAQNLMRARRPLVVSGSPISQGAGTATFIAGMSLNILLDRIGKTGGVRPLAELPAVVGGASARSEYASADFVEFLMAVGAGNRPAPGVLLVYEANPRYALPQAETMNKALDKIPFVVSFSSFLDETAAKADLLMPNPMFCERAEDLETPYGSGFSCYTQSLPVIAPVVDAKPTADVLLALAGKLGLGLGFESFEEVLAAKAEGAAALGGFIADETMPWDAIASGDVPGLDGDLADAFAEGKAWVAVEPVAQSGLALAPQVLAKAAKPAAGGSYPLSLAPQYNLNIGSGKMAMPGYNLQTIREDELHKDAMSVFLNAATAAKAGVQNGDKVKVSGPNGEISARVCIDETVMPGVLSAPLGFGHTAWDEFSRGKGDNVCKILTVANEPETGMPVWIGSKVKIAKS